MNLLSTVAEMLGVKLDEEFQLVDTLNVLNTQDCVYKITENGLLSKRKDYKQWSHSVNMDLLLAGRLIITVIE